MEDFALIVPEELNARLREPYTAEEFKKHTTKAPCIDGFSALFIINFSLILRKMFVERFWIF